MWQLARFVGPADREKTRYYGKIAVAPNLWRAAFGAIACVLVASCTTTAGLATRDGTGWACEPLDPLQGELPAEPCFRATLSDHNLVTVEWRVRNSRGLVFLADALGPNYVDPGYQPADCDDANDALQACAYTQRVSTGGFHRWQLRVSAPTGENLFVTTTLAVPAPYPPGLSGGGAVDVLAPEPAPVTWTADSRNAPYSTPKHTAWVAVQDPTTGRWPWGGRWPRTGPDARYSPLADMFNAAGELKLVVRDCRRIANTRSKLCSPEAWAGFFSSGDYFLADNPLFIDSGSAPTIGFTTHAGTVREIESASLLPQGPVQTTEQAVTLSTEHLTPGEHSLSLRSCRGDSCSKPHRLRILVDGAVDWETARDYEKDFYPARAHNLFGKGKPLDITWDPQGNIWMTTEFSNSLTHVDPRQRVDAYEAPLARHARFASANPTLNRPFGLNMGKGPRRATSGSALSEKVIVADGKLWFTQGGDRYAGKVKRGGNYSRVVSFDPAAVDLPTTEHDDRFCVYAMPSAPDSQEGDNHVLGIAASEGRIWVTELRSLRSERPAAISSFVPAAVSCANTLNYADPRSRAKLMAYCAGGSSAATGCVETWRVDKAKPAMLEVEPADGSLWFTDAHGMYLGNFNPDSKQPITLHALPGPGRITWSIRLDADAIYFASYNNRTLYRFDKRSKTFHVIAIPSPATRGALLHSIDIDHRQRRLWFTLTNQGDVPHQQDASTIGYIDLDSWKTWVSGSAQEKIRGVVYSGLTRAPYPERRPPRHQSFAGIALEPASGRIAIATDWRKQITELTPRPAFVAEH